MEVGEWVDDLGEAGLGFILAEGGGRDLSRTLAMRAMATADVCGAGWPRAGEVMGEGRSIECSRGRERRKTTRRSPLCHHGQNRAAMTRRPARRLRRRRDFQEVYASPEEVVGMLGQRD
jgi:hypothetical protein